MLTPRFIGMLYGAALLLSFSLWAQQTKVEIDEKLFDIEAQIASLKDDIEKTNSIASQERPSAFNPSISVVGDIIGQYGFKLHKEGHTHGDDEHAHAGEFHNGILVREIEFEFRGDVDPFADALVALGVHPHGFDHVHLHLEAAYARLKAWPGLGYAPWDMIIKAGLFPTALGRSNRIHLHNFPQITYPRAMTTFLGEEGHQAPGLSINVAFNPTAMSALNLFAEGVFHSRLPMQEKGAEKIPAGVFHGWWHQELLPAHFLDVGASTLVSRKGARGSGVFWLLSGDVHYSYLPAGYGQNPVFLFGNEFFTANSNGGAGRFPIGNFTWAQMRMFGSSFIGVRYDLAPQEEDLKKFQHAAALYATHYTTEFLRFRLGYEHVMPNISSFAGDHRLILSMIFILGSHPVEPYFVNR